ncbi:hypothetical protein ACWGST_03290 [Agromyces sp. NPDC055520]
MVDALGEATTELYGLRPDEFTAARNGRAQAVATDDRELAARIRELRRPSPAAWLVNQLVRHRPDEVEAVLRLGAEARGAQGGFDAAELAELGRQRRRLVSTLAREAGELAEELGAPVRNPVLDEVAQTLQAAISDAAAADAVRTGRLVRALEAVGVEVDLSDAVAGGPVPRTEPDPAPARDREPDPAPYRASRGTGGPPQPSAAASKRARAERERSERTVAEAEKRAAAASAELDALDARLAEADRVHRDLLSRRDELEAELRRVEAEIAEADRAKRPLTRERDRAARDADAAEVDAEEAREALGALE